MIDFLKVILFAIALLVLSACLIQSGYEKIEYETIQEQIKAESMIQ